MWPPFMCYNALDSHFNFAYSSLKPTFMSYDLFFAPTYRNCGLEEFVEYFQGRPNYDVDGGTASYFNEYTGVSFLFEYNSDAELGDQENELGESELDEEVDADEFRISFNINFYRPSFFGLEAANEVIEFVTEFELAVMDPQAEDEEDVFSAESFLAGWNAGNQFAFRAILSNDEYDQHPLTYPTAGLLETWKWNYERDELQDRLGDDIFVPRIYFMNLDGKIVTASLWPDAIPICLPKVDYILVLRKELSSEPDAEEPQILRIAWKDLAPHIERYSFEEDFFYRLEFEYPDESLCAVIRKLPLQLHDPELIQAYDNVLDAELVKMART